jgi:F-type H+-transporting ATPase subunit a
MALGTLFAEGSNPLSHVVQHPLKSVPADLGMLTPEGQITVMSNHISMIILGGLLLMLLLPPLLRRRKADDPVERLVPRGFANGMEVICQYLRTEVAEPSLGKQTDRFIKYIWSVFFFVLVLNVLGMLPIAALSPLAGLHLGGTATGNFWVTGTMALLTLLMVVVNGVRLGGVEYLKHFVPGPWWMAPILLPVEIIGLLAKIFALAIRLFANMLAGHLVLGVLLGFIFSAGAASAAMGWAISVPVVLGSVALSMLELFVAFLQAFIFAFLTTVFIGMAVTVHHEGGHEELHPTSTEEVPAA